METYVEASAWDILTKQMYLDWMAQKNDVEKQMAMIRLVPKKKEKKKEIKTSEQLKEYVRQKKSH